MRIAVIGGGIAGNLTANLLSAEHEVELFEAGAYAGGHTNTVDVELSDELASDDNASDDNSAGGVYPVDTGFMVFNDRTYPNFCEMLEKLSVESREAEMSFGVRCDRTGLEYQGSSLNGLFAQRRNFLRPKFYGMLRDIMRFHRICHDLLNDEKPPAEETLGEFIRHHGLGASFEQDYLAPMCAAIWSAPPARVLDAPALYFIHFFSNHGLIQVTDRPQWRTIVGGARKYVERLLAPINDRVHLNTPVNSVRREAGRVLLEIAGDQQAFDAVVLATHADTTLRLLADADQQEREVLSEFPYQDNLALVHTDTSILPRRRRAWASWNYRRCADPSAPLSVTYDVSRLQGHDSPTPILVTLNDDSVAPESIISSIPYRHPQYHLGTPAAQQRITELNGRRGTYFAGAYWGYGFHEDGVRSSSK